MENIDNIKKAKKYVIPISFKNDNDEILLYEHVRKQRNCSVYIKDLIYNDLFGEKPSSNYPKNNDNGGGFEW